METLFAWHNARRSAVGGNMKNIFEKLYADFVKTAFFYQVVYEGLNIFPLPFRQERRKEHDPER